MSRFNTQQAACEAAGKDDVVIGEEYVCSAKRYYIVAKVRDYVARYVKMVRRCAHEILVPGKPCRLAFDIETTAVGSDEVEAAVRRIVDLVAKPFVLLDCSREVTIEKPDAPPRRVFKVSLHLVFPDVVLASSEHVYYYVKRLLSNPSEFFVDESVFLRTPGSLRCAYSSSFNSKRVLVPKGASQDVSVDETVFLKSLLCLPGLVPNVECELPIPARMRGVSSSSGCMADDVYVTAACEIVPLFINSKYGADVKVLRAANKDRDYDVCFYVNSPCPFANRTHKGNHGIFVVQLIHPRFLDRTSRVRWAARVKTRYMCLDNECHRREQDGSRVNSGILSESEADERLLTALIYGELEDRS